MYGMHQQAESESGVCGSSAKSSAPALGDFNPRFSQGNTPDVTRHLGLASTVARGRTRCSRDKIPGDFRKQLFGWAHIPVTCPRAPELPSYELIWGRGGCGGEEEEGGEWC